MDGEVRTEVPRWQVRGERTLYASDWVRLVKVDVEPPNGRRFEHHVVRLQRVAVVIVVNVDDEVLMLRRHRFVTDEVGLELPGGIVAAEESASSAAAREAEEETGWRPSGLVKLIEFQPMIGMVDTPHEVFLASSSEHIGEPTDLEEAGRVEWIPVSDVTELIRRGEILGSGSLAGLLFYLSTRG